jgi:transposase
MARAYSQDLRDRVIKTALGGVSVRQAAARYGVSASTAILWACRARSGEVNARRQGQPKGSKLDAHAAFLLELIDASSHISLHEMQAELQEERGVSAGIGTLWRFFHARAITVKKTRMAKLTGRPAVREQPGRRRDHAESGCAAFARRVAFPAVGASSSSARGSPLPSQQPSFGQQWSHSGFP